MSGNWIPLQTTRWAPCARRDGRIRGRAWTPSEGLRLFLPGLAVSIRRLHDTNRSEWWYLLTIVPFGAVALMVSFCLESATADGVVYTKTEHRNADADRDLATDGEMYRWRGAAARQRHALPATWCAPG